MPPKVSVIMPAYNVARFIRAAVDSVLAQSFVDYELLIINDGSTDETLEVLSTYADSRIRIVNQRNRGLAGARNSGIRESVGQYIALLDSDDIWLPDKLSQHVQHLDGSQNVGISYSASEFVSDSGERLGLYQTPQVKGVSAVDVLCRNPVGNGSAPVIRREALDDIKAVDSRYGEPEPVFFDPDFRQSEDIECWFRIAATTEWLVEGIAQPLTLYRLNTGGLSASVYRQLDSWEAFILKAQSYAPDIVTRYASLARAYQYRYLARRAIWSDESIVASRLMRQALLSDWRIIVREPARTLTTVVAVMLQRILPRSVFTWIKSFAVTQSHRKR